MRGREPESTQPIEATPAETVAPRFPHLLVLSGPGVGDIYRIDRPETVLGRDPAADIRLQHPSVSRRHARLIQLSDGLAIEDLGSRNGTLVGIRRAARGQLLKDGDTIALGHILLLKLSYSIVLDEAFRRAGYQSASRDPATRVGNTEYLLDRLATELAYARRHRSPLTLALFRADHLLPSDGHADRAMGRLAVTIHEAIRAEDVLARSSHDEFVAILRADADQATLMAERVRQHIVDLNDGLVADQHAHAVSAAIIPVGAVGREPPARLLAAAQQSARAAMGDGENRVVGPSGVLRLGGENL